MTDISLILKYFPDLTDSQKKHFETLGPLYHDWNEKINVISRKDIDELYVRHVLHSMAIAKFGSFPSGSRILDIGTGGGFPGIPLAILFPECKWLLVDSIGKKIKVVNEVIEALGLTNVQGVHTRAESIKGPFNYIVSRAVAQTKVLLDWTQHLILSDDRASLASGYILLKGGDLQQELKEIKRSYSIKDIPDFFDEPFFETKKIVYIPV